MPIPVRNVYHMLCYANGKLGEQDLAVVGDDESPDKFDLLGLVLASICRGLLKRGLDRSYREFSEDTKSPRGKLDLATTAKRCLRRATRVQCEFEDLSRNVLHNQILKSCLVMLVRTQSLEDDTLGRLRDVIGRMEGIDDIRLERSHFLRVQLHPNNRHYRFPLEICRLVHGNLLPLKGGSGYAFRDFSFSDEKEEKKRLEKLFEAFVIAFYENRLSASYANRKSRRILWDYEVLDGENHLPQMEADLILCDRRRGMLPRFLIDMKYVTEPMKSRQGGAFKYLSSNLYQVLTYLQNLYRVENLEEKPTGLLLYAHPGTGKEFVPGSYKLCGFPFRMEAVDLSKKWREIEEDLLGLIPQESATAV